MPVTPKSILKQARKLSVDERTLLAHDIWRSVEDDCDSEPLSEEIKAELDRRIEEHRKNPTAGITWEELKRKLRRRKRRCAS